MFQLNACASLIKVHSDKLSALAFCKDSFEDDLMKEKAEIDQYLQATQ